MSPSFRSVLLLGSAVVALSSSAALADDPLLPEGAERPVMGKELILPPIINEAPANAEIVLPPPGQEHLLGARPQGVEAKVEARVADETLNETKTAQATKPTKKARKAATETQTAEAVAAAPAVVAQPEPKIVETGARMADLTQPAMGGPELAGPPTPKDGMTVAEAPIRDGDALSPQVANALTTAPAAQPAKTNAPAIERFEIAQATSTPMPVTPKTSAPSGRGWDVELSGTIGYGAVDTAAQNYFGKISEDDRRISAASFVGIVPVGAPLVQTDNDDDVITYEVAAKINLTGDVEPLGGGSNVEPYVKVAVSGYEADFASNPADLTTNYDESIFVPGVEGGEGYGHGGGWLPVLLGDDYDIYNGNYEFDSVRNIQYRGKESVIKGLLEYGQTWKGSSGLDVTGFAQIAHTRRDYEHTLKFTGFGLDNGCEYDWSWDIACEKNVSILAEIEGYDGVYATDLDSDTTSFGLGIGISFPLTKDRRWKADANARGSYDVTNVRGRDSLLIVNNEGGGVMGSSTTRIKATEESFGYGAGAGISYAVSDSFSLRLGAEFTSQEAAPVVVRDGINPSRVEFEREDLIVGTLTAKITF